MEHGYQALSLMERHLAHRRYFVGARTTVADLALYAHTHVAQEGEFELGGFPHLIDWLARIAGEAGHIRMDEMPEGARVGADTA
jgi:glutathione S-transferase